MLGVYNLNSICRVLAILIPAISLAVIACQSEADPPNILLICADDIGYADVSAFEYAAEDVQTPNIDRIASSGVVFTNGYAASPICNVSRSGLVTGQYPRSNGTFWYGGPGLRDITVGTTLAEQLQTNGYRTVSIGKHHFGDTGEPGNTDAQLQNARDNPVNHGFDEFFGFIHSEKDYSRNTQQDLDDFIAKAMAGGVIRQDAEQRARQAVIGPMIRATHNAGSPTYQREDQPGYTTDIFTTEAITHFARFQETPVFLQLNYNSLHTQLWNAVPQEYMDARGITEQEIADFMPGMYDGMTEFWAFNNAFAWFAAGPGEDQLGDIDDPRDTAANRFRRKLYLAALDHLDANIGRLLQALEQAGTLDNTIVIFTGDNGGSHNIAADNGPLSGHKYMLGEGGVRVPFIIMWQERTVAGSVIVEPVSQMDLTDTILAAAGLRNITRTDGRDITGILLGQIDQDYRTQFWDSGDEWAVRHGNWKLRVITSQRNFPNFTEQPGEFLYRLDSDPSEQNNLAQDYPALVDALTKLHQTWVMNSYEAGPIHRDNSLITNGSFENTTGVNQLANAWQQTPDTDQAGATVGGVIGAEDGVWRGYLRELGVFTQVTEHEVQAGAIYTLRFSVNTNGAAEHGLIARLLVQGDTGEHEYIRGWSIHALANDGDATSWQTYESTFIAEQDATYVGQRLGVTFEATGPDGYRAIDDVSLSVELPPNPVLEESR